MWVLLPESAIPRGTQPTELVAAQQRRYPRRGRNDAATKTIEQPAHRTGAGSADRGAQTVEARVPSECSRARSCASWMRTARGYSAQARTGDPWSGRRAHDAGGSRPGAARSEVDAGTDPERKWITEIEDLTIGKAETLGPHRAYRPPAHCRSCGTLRIKYPTLESATGALMFFLKALRRGSGGLCDLCRDEIATRKAAASPLTRSRAVIMMGAC